MDQDQQLCDYIFGLLEPEEVLKLEEKLKTSESMADRLQELNEIFCGLDTVKNDFPSPVSKFMDKCYRLSYACATFASALTIFWVTMFGGVNNDYDQSSHVSNTVMSIPEGISCISGIVPTERATQTYTDLAIYRE